MGKKVNFKSRARLMPQLGDQLIKNAGIAILELVKNSYDADAQNVTIRMFDIDKPLKGRISILDNGSGMDADIVENVWMEIGTDDKKIKFDQFINQNRSSKLGRLPMGEKGIGRFGVHKLGRKITMITRRENSEEVVVKVDWDLFDDFRYLEDVPVEISLRKPEMFLGDATGTYIEITDLKQIWKRGELRDVYRAVTSLQSPFESLQSFNIRFETNHLQWLTGLMELDDVKSNALYFADVEIKDDEISNLKYIFEPWTILSKLDRREYELKNYPMKIKEKKSKEINYIDLSRYSIGTVRMKLIIFDLDNTILSYGIADKKGLKDYLKSNGGIAIYRDNIRIYEYGESGNDWLELESRRINSPGEVLSSKITIGAVYINRSESSDLIEKTNREGFVENAAFSELKKAILFSIDKIQTQRNFDKQLLRKYYSPSGKDEPVMSSIEDLRIIVDKNIEDIKLRNQLNKSLDIIEEDYKRIIDVYIRSASAGLSLSVVIHEIEKIISELNQTIKSEKTSEHLKFLIEDLSKVTDGYASIIKKKQQAFCDVTDILERSIFNVKYRLMNHKVEICKGNFGNGEKIKCSENLILGTIMNIIDNSIWWLDFANIKDKKIYISTSDDYAGYISLVFADNGLGFTLPTEQISKPFVSDRSGGMGLGLHLADQIMNIHKGKLIFPQEGDIYIPEGFEKGAKVVLAFPIE